MTTKRFFDFSGREIILHDTEDKQWWMEYGESEERAFLIFAKKLGVLAGLSENPERVSTGRRGLPEFVREGHLVDLKVQQQPFFESERFYGVPPRYAVTLNYRDIQDVRTKYPDCHTVFWVKWKSGRYLKERPRKTMPNKVEADISIEPMHGIWTITPKELIDLEDNAIKQGNLHWYSRRYGDRRGNARSSYVLDIRTVRMLWLDPQWPPIEPIVTS